MAGLSSGVPLDRNSSEFEIPVPRLKVQLRGGGEALLLDLIGI